MNNRRTHDRAALKREPQVLNDQELIVYEAIAILRGPAKTDELTAATGLGEGTVRAAVNHLAELEMVIESEEGTSLGPNDWDVRGAQ